MGGEPDEPRSSRVSTIPIPKSCCQKRFTAMRAVSGFSVLAIQRAMSSLVGLLGFEVMSGGSAFGVFALVMRLPFSSQLPRSNTWVFLLSLGSRIFMMGMLGPSVAW